MSKHAAGAQDLLTVEEVATALRCSDKTVRRYIADGVVPALRLGGRLLIARAALADIVARATATTAGPGAHTMALGGRR